VIAVPRPGFEPDAGILRRATVVLPSLVGLDDAAIARVLAA